MRNSRFVWMALALTAMSAAPAPTPEDFIRDGNAAVEQGRWEDALAYYDRADERGTDPGLIAFNKGTAYYRLNDFRRAENHFRMALDDAAIPAERRAKALYNLGDCLVKQAGEQELRLLRDAIRCYELCLDETADEGLRRDAEFNLELAKLLWNKARANNSKPPDPNTDEPPDNPQEPPRLKKKEEPKTGADPGTDKGGKKPVKAADKDGKKKDGMTDAKVEMKKSDVPRDVGPPVPPDTDEVHRQSPQDTLEALRRVETRLHKERQRLREEAAVLEKPSGRDW